MEYRIDRCYPGSEATIGQLFADGKMLCWTLENTKLMIPAGTYELELYDSPKHGPDTPQLKNVPGRENIQIHVANYPHELLGCIALGSEKGENAVWNSKYACSYVLPQLRDAVKAGKTTISIA